MFDAFEFSASTLPVLGRTKNTFTEQTAFFRLECPVVDCFGVFHLALTPGTNRFWIGNGDANLVEGIGLAFKAEDFVEVGF